MTASPLADIAAEIGTAAARIAEGDIAALEDAIAEAGHVMLAGCGREGLMMRALAMRLAHLGLSASVQGDMTAPPLGPGDLFLASAGPGQLATIEALMSKARAAGARVLLVTGVPDAPLSRLAEHTLVIPAATMAGGGGSALPMGSAYEGAMFVLFEGLVTRLAARLGQSEARMRSRHTNME